LLLFPEPLGNHGHVRTVVGALCERLTCELTGGRRHKTQGTADYCPDVSLAGRYFESKAAGKKGETFVYEGRLAKDRLFAAAFPLSYVIWHHKTDTLRSATVDELEAAVLVAMRAVYVVPFAALDAAALASPVMKLNSGYGQTRHTDKKIYGSGRRVRLGSLAPYKLLQWSTGLDAGIRAGWPIVSRAGDDKGLITVRPPKEDVGGTEPERDR
jgi:hypothetical protein